MASAPNQRCFGRGACSLALSCRLPFAAPFFWRLCFLAIWGPSLLSSVALSHRRGKSAWSCSVTVNTGSLLFADVWGRAADCRPDAGTHLQLSREDLDAGPSVSRVIPKRIHHLLLFVFKGTRWPYSTGKPLTKKCFFLYALVEYKQRVLPSII